MFITTHAAMGALIGELLPTHPALAFFVAMAAHFAIDIVPHGDTGLYKEYIAGSKIKRAVAFVTVDGVIALLLVTYLFVHWWAVPERAIAFGITGGVLPDLLVGVYEVTHARALRWFHRLHFFFHNLISSRTGDVSLGAGLVVEAMVFAIVLTRLV